MKTVTITLNIDPEELRNIRNTLTALQGKDVLNDSQTDAIEGLLTLTDTIKDAIDEVDDTPVLDDSICPVCGGDDIQGGHMEVDSNDAFQPCKCSCGASWNNTYTFNGSSEIKEGQLIFH